jgi:hypothetical protein
VRILFVFESPGFHLGAEDAQRADAGVACVREDDLARTPGGDHLIVNNIRCGAGEDEVLLALADDFVCGGERDEVSEPGGVHEVAVVDVLGDGGGEGCEFGHNSWRTYLYGVL